MSDHSDRLLHSVSLILASLVADLSAKDSEDELEDLITAYRCVRRRIKVNPITGKRFGAEHANKMIQGDIP